MSSAEQAQQLPPQTPSFAMLRTLGGVAMLAGFLVVMVFQWTKPIIDENKRIAIEKAVFRVVPGAASRKDYVLGADGLFKAEEAKSVQGEKIYAAYDAEGALKGIAMEAAATGYADVIRILYGYNPGCECVTGIKVLKMAETPGLGDKIAFDPEFLENFVALDGKLNAEKSGLANKIVAVKHGTKSEPWQVDSISGATISSVAIARMINQSGQKMFPLIMKHLDELKGN
jgi:electron transport complex protein RnfG